MVVVVVVPFLVVETETPSLETGVVDVTLVVFFGAALTSSLTGVVSTTGAGGGAGTAAGGGGVSCGVVCGCSC
jgi:hypothetical protein